ncbi:CAP domain-containing protein, partial [bacterium]
MDKKTIYRFFIASEENNYRPPILSYRAFIIYGLILLILRLLFSQIPQVSGSAIESDTLMRLINSERSQRNLVTLSTHASLVKAAGEKSQDMIDRGYFAHIDPDGNYVWGRIVNAGYPPYKILGENLAIDFSTAEGMITAWLDSPTHRANLLHPDFVDQGLAALYGTYQNRYTNLTTSLFGTPVAKSSTPPAAKSNVGGTTQVPPKTETPPPAQKPPEHPPVLT